MIRALAFALAALPGPLAALSCVAPNASAIYGYYNAAPGEYVIMRGRISRSAPVPPPVGDYDMEAAPFQAVFSGEYLGGSGVQNMPITVYRDCITNMCGGVPLNEPLVFFAERKGGALSLRVGPCPGGAWPDDQQIRAELLGCLRGSRSCTTP